MVSKLPHVKYSSVWFPHVALGIALAYYYGFFDMLKSILLFIGIFFASMYQHYDHVLRGASSTYKIESLEERLYFRMLWSTMFVLSWIIAGILIVLTNFGILLFVVCGFICLHGYARLHKQSLWGIGHTFTTLGSMYAISGFITISAILIAVGVSSLAYIGICAYRMATGDYDSVPPGPQRGLPKIILAYILGIILVVLGIVAL